MNVRTCRLLPISATVTLFATLITAAAADETIKIGHVAPLTGDRKSVV